MALERKLSRLQQSMQRNAKNPELQREIGRQVATVQKALEQAAGNQQRLDSRIRENEEQRRGFKF